MLVIFAIVIVLCIGVSRWSAGRFEQLIRQGGREQAPTAHTGREIAQLFFAFEGIDDVEIVEHNGVISDCFDPKRRRLFLSREVADGTTMAAWSIALHEAAHAGQVGEALGEFKWRQSVIRMSRYGPMFGVLGMIGMFLMRLPPRFAIAAFVALCVMFLLLNLGTLAIEFNANARLQRFLEKHLDRHPDALDRLNSHLSAVATREVGDLLRSPRYFFFSALPGTGRIRPVK